MRQALSLVLVVGLLGFASTAGASPYPLSEILDKAAAEKLAAQEVKTSDELLEKAATVKGRAALAKATKLPLAKLNAWAKMCDLLRIKGVGPEMVRLLGAARVNTVKQLKGQKPAKLLKALTAANKKKKITENPPDEQQLANWIDQAKKLKLVLR